MKDEIKEILDFIKEQIEKETLSYEPDIELSKEEARLLLDYITNLQKENEILKDIVVEKDCQLKDMMLQKTDYTAVNILEMKLEYYKSRNDKAIEYIKNSIDNTGWLEIGSSYVNELLEILGDKE